VPCEDGNSLGVTAPEGEVDVLGAFPDVELDGDVVVLLDAGALLNSSLFVILVPPCANT
jgi:hypothetical protein